MVYSSHKTAVSTTKISRPYLTIDTKFAILLKDHSDAILGKRSLLCILTAVSVLWLVAVWTDIACMRFRFKALPLATPIPHLDNRANRTNLNLTKRDRGGKKKPLNFTEGAGKNVILIPPARTRGCARPPLQLQPPPPPPNPFSPPLKVPPPPLRVLSISLRQGWAIHFPKGPHEIVGLLWRAGPIGWTQFCSI